jgi:pimeloyl-ACP methyl ester carboxylesterase
VISPDRPGIGLSDYQFRRTVADWPDDVAELADSLGLARFSVLGPSGGAPYAAACAWKLRRRLTGVGLVAGIGPIDAPGATVGMSRTNWWLFRVAGRLPLAPTAVIGLAAVRARRPERLLSSATVSDVDRPYWNRMKEILEPTIAEAFRQGGKGQARELRLLTRPWGFRLEDIQVPVRLWHGERDPNSPVAMARHVAAMIPNCRATYHPDEGHLFFVGERLTEILRALRP